MNRLFITIMQAFYGVSQKRNVMDKVSNRKPKSLSHPKDSHLPSVMLFRFTKYLLIPIFFFFPVKN